MENTNKIQHKVRNEVMFAGIRKPIKTREELIPRMEEIADVCKDFKLGPLVHIMRFDTPVDGFDSEIGYQVNDAVNVGEVQTHTLRELQFFSMMHQGSPDTLRETSLKLYEFLRTTGLSPELELVEIYHYYEPDQKDDSLIEVRVSFLAWPEIYKKQLLRVLGPELTSKIWAGGELITPFTLVDERAAWVGKTLERLKQHSDQEQQFDILSRVALVRPLEDVKPFKEMYEKNGNVDEILAVQNENLAKTPTGGFIDPHWYDGDILHLSKVAYNREAYDAAETHDELRKAYCFCSLIREATSPQVDPIFCYRAAGWARQFWEPILEVEFKTCNITHSILKGDRFCAWDYILTDAHPANRESIS